MRCRSSAGLVFYTGFRELKISRRAEAEEAAAAKAAKRKAAAEEAADREEQRKQRYQYLKEKREAQGQLQGAESKEYIKMQDAFNAKRRRKAESPAEREIRISKMSCYNKLHPDARTNKMRKIK